MIIYLAKYLATGRLIYLVESITKQNLNTKKSSVLIYGPDIKVYRTSINIFQRIVCKGKIISRDFSMQSYHR